jgi:transcriptional regulator with XRE-family HTH domain
MAGRPEAPKGLETIIDPVDLGDRVRAKRRSKKLSIREAAKEIGVSAPTVSRVERGSHLPDLNNLLLLARWAGVRIDPVLHPDSRRLRNALVHDPHASTPEAVELHLRADKNLDRGDAEALAEMFRLAYEALSAKRPRSKGKAKGKAG